MTLVTAGSVAIDVIGTSPDSWIVRSIAGSVIEAGTVLPARSNVWFVIVARIAQ
jgi:hypothetical protein